MKDRIVSFFTSKVLYLSLKDIKGLLKIKRDTKELKKCLNELEKEGIICYDEETKMFCTKTNFLFVKRVREYLKNASCKIDEKELEEIPQDILKLILYNLELDGIIYNDNDNYYLTSSDFFNDLISKLFLSENKLKLNDIRNLLNLKMNNSKLLSILKKLEINGIIYYDVEENFYIKFPSKHFINKLKCLLLNNDGLNIHNIIKKLHFLGSVERINVILDSFIKKGIIYYEEKLDVYMPLQEDYKKVRVESSKKGSLYIKLDNKVKMLPTSISCDLLPFDEIIIKRSGKNEIELVKIVKRNNPEIVCEVLEKGIKVVGNKDLKVWINKKSLKELGLPVGTRFLANISTIKNNDGFLVNYIETLGSKNDFNAEFDAIAYNNGFVTHYTKEELEEIDSLPSTVREIDKEGRVDLTGECIFTIDGSHTKDIDDAVSIKILPNGNYELTVSIAAVNSYIKFGSPLWKRAEKNTTSLYMIDSVSHMLHFLVSNGICSLNPNEERLAKSYRMEINYKGAIVNFEILDTVIKSRKQMTYKDVNKILEKNIIPPGYDEFVPDLIKMYELSQILDARHKKDGALDFGSKEIRFILDDTGNITDIESVKQGAAEKLIENFMVAANEGLADYMLKLGVTFIYRNHEIPFDKKVLETTQMIKGLGYKINKIKTANNPHLIQKIIMSLSEKEEFIVLSSLLLRSMQKAYYSTENKGHYALALNGYSQCTSPIRRFLDLLIQYILNNLEEICSPEFNMEEFKSYVSSMCERASVMERCAEKAEYEADKLYMINYCKEHPNNEYEGFIQEVTPGYLVVKTKELIEGIVYLNDINDDTFVYNPTTKWVENPRTKERLLIGSKLRLTLKDWNSEYRIIYFKGSTMVNDLILKRKKIVN